MLSFGKRFDSTEPPSPCCTSRQLAYGANDWAESHQQVSHLSKHWTASIPRPMADYLPPPPAPRHSITASFGEAANRLGTLNHLFLVNLPHSQTDIYRGGRGGTLQNSSHVQRGNGKLCGIRHPLERQSWREYIYMKYSSMPLVLEINNRAKCTEGGVFIIPCF